MTSPPTYSSSDSIDTYGALNSSIRWDYRLHPPPKLYFIFPKDIWAYFDFDVKNIENSFNLSDYKGISFYIKGNQEDQLMEFNVFTHNVTLNHEVYQYTNNHLIVRTNWRHETIYFNDLVRTPWTTEWYPGSSEKPDLNSVFAFGFAVKTDHATQNQIWIDEIYLIKNNDERLLLMNFDGNKEPGLNGVLGQWHSGWGYRS